MLPLEEPVAKGGSFEDILVANVAVSTIGMVWLDTGTLFVAWGDTVVDPEVVDVAGNGLDSAVEERPMAVVTWLVDRLLE